MARYLFAFVAALAFAAPAFATPHAPRAPIARIADLPQPLPLPYDASADAGKAVAQARARARREHKKLLIDLGGNWCPDCRMLMGVMELPSLRAFLDRHFVIVTVDIGRFDRNGDIAAHYGIRKLEGVPAILVVDPKSDRLVNRGHLFALADWLAQWA
ncbi:MAG TPA: thioredoxin family protein [Sphingomonas sp.]|nr:thioredoxin family protein [Sphingomonas sp.]